MKKIAFIAVFMIVSALPAGAQVLSFGVKAGTNINTANLDRFFSGGQLSTDNPAGYHFGLMSRIRIPLTGFHIQPEALLNSNTTRFNFSNLISSAFNANTRLSVRRMELDIPILAGFKFFLFRFNVGPVFKFNISDKATAGMTADDVIAAELKKKHVGYQVGVGFDLLSLTFDVRYYGNFGRTNAMFYRGNKLSNGTELTNSANSILQQFKLSGGQVMFSVGYMF